MKCIVPTLVDHSMTRCVRPILIHVLCMYCVNWIPLRLATLHASSFSVKKKLCTPISLLNVDSGICDIVRKVFSAFFFFLCRSHCFVSSTDNLKWVICGTNATCYLTEQLYSPYLQHNSTPNDEIFRINSIRLIWLPNTLKLENIKKNFIHCHPGKFICIFWWEKWNLWRVIRTMETTEMTDLLADTLRWKCKCQ